MINPLNNYKMRNGFATIKDYQNYNWPKLSQYSLLKKKFQHIMKKQDKWKENQLEDNLINKRMENYKLVFTFQKLIVMVIEFFQEKQLIIQNQLNKMDGKS